MGLLSKDSFICLDCETTGLTPKTDRIIEVAIVRFNFTQILDSFETLVDPEGPISPESMAIHHITNEMVQGKPKIQDILPHILECIGKDIIVGHGINNDLAFLSAACEQHAIPCHLHQRSFIDTLRLARLYGKSPINSLEKLRQHFNIAEEGAHRAMSDVIVNIEVFKHLCQSYKTTDEILERLKRPILLKAMPLGKHKGRLFSEIPIQYLQWAVHQDFDQDLIFSLKTELKQRKQGTRFNQAINPFAEL